MNNLIMILPCLALSVGFYFGYKIGKEQNIKISTPVQIIKKKQEERQAKHEKDVLNQYIANLDNYPHNQVSIKE